MKFALLSFVLWIGLPAHAQFEYDLSKIVRRAHRLKKDKEQYQTFFAKEQSIWESFFEIQNSRLHVKPSLPEFNGHYTGEAPLPVPVEYYYLRILEESDNTDNYGLMIRALLDGIAHHPNRKESQQLVFFLLSEEGCPAYYRDKKVLMDYAISSTANKDWVNDYLDDKLSDTSQYAGLNHRLINDWAEQLSESNKKKAEMVLRSQFNRGPSNGKGERFYKLMYRLYPKKTQIELLSYWNQLDTFARGTHYYNFYVFNLLRHFKTKNLEAARIVDKYRQACDKPKTDLGELQRFNSIFFFLNPEKGKKEIRTSFEKACLNKEELAYYYFNLSDFYPHFKTIFDEPGDTELMSQYVLNCDGLPDLGKHAMMELILSRDRKLFEQTILVLKNQSLVKGHVNGIVYLWSLNLVRANETKENKRLLEQLGESIFWKN